VTCESGGKEKEKEIPGQRAISDDGPKYLQRACLEMQKGRKKDKPSYSPAGSGASRKLYIVKKIKKGAGGK